MPRKNTGPRLAWRKDIGAYVIRWYDQGKKRERSTGTSDYQTADEAFEAFKADIPIGRGPRRGDQLPITVMISLYLQDKEGHVADTARLGYAAAPLLEFFDDSTVSSIRGNTCRAYVRWRKAEGTDLRLFVCSPWLT